jgi:hypothetical protein
LHTENQLPMLPETALIVMTPWCGGGGDPLDLSLTRYLRLVSDNTSLIPLRLVSEALF